MNEMRTRADFLARPAPVPPVSAPASNMPPEAPLDMPVQSLSAFDRRTRHRDTRKHVAPTWIARLAVFGGGLALTIYGAHEMYKVVEVGGVTPLKWALLILFVGNFSWISVAFTAGVVGFLWLLFNRSRTPPLPETLSARTAVVMPIYNEAPSRVFAAVQAMFEDVERSGLGAHFDWFFLSDTTNPDVWIAEERAFLALRARLPDGSR
ncbi:MAG: rane glycosyltransferase, partial [Methylobacteriaceae bacterium]|nr:rane glycosyltransferase [Methylobacteriaceae bacterium]